MKWLAPILLACLCGCAGSRYTRLDNARPPEALVIPKKELSKAERRSFFESHRGFVNDLGVQIGRRHFDARLLPDYFRRSGLEPFARHAESFEWGRQARKKANSLQGKYEWPFTKGFVEGLRGQDFWGEGGILVVIAAGIVVDLVGKAVYEGWRIVAQAELDRLSRKAAEFQGTPEVLMSNYNYWLALSLGVSPTSAALSPVKTFPPPWPVQGVIAVNSEKNDWCEDYHLERFREKWYFGGKEVDGYYAMNIFGENFNAETRKNKKVSYTESAISAYNSGLCARIFPEVGDHAAQDHQ